MTSVNVGIEDARKRLGDLITATQQGIDVTITRNGKPAARLVYIPEETMMTVAELAAAVDMSSAPEKVARYVGAFTEHDPRTGTLPKRWNGKGMDATFTSAEAAQLIASWTKDATHAERMAFLLPDDAEHAEIAERYRP